MPVSNARIAMVVSIPSVFPAAMAAIKQEMKPSKKEGFGTLLEQHVSKVKEARTKAEDAAAGLVSMALIMPMLRQVRRSAMNTKGPFSPGIAEKSFGPEFDMQLASRIAHSPRMGATKVLADRLMKRIGPKQVLDVDG
jgi:hypothetical protein